MQDIILDGILNILKPPGMTSHDVVSFVRKTLHTKKVGHAGTLDPDACGVLPIFVGKATRLIEYATDANKTYRVHLQFGIQTDTGDDSGNVVSQSEIYNLSAARIDAVLTSFLGAQQQIPPMYSALKHEGKKLYELARAGIEVERRPRDIIIEKLILLKQYPEGLYLEVTCSKGTYIRTLIEDIARKMDMVATMVFLLRTHVGVFNIQETVSLEELSENCAAALRNSEFAIAHLAKVLLTEKQSLRFTQGVLTTIQGIEDKQLQGQKIRVYSYDESFLGIGSVQANQIKPLKVFSIVRLD